MEEVRPSVQMGRHGFRAHSRKKAANGNGFPPTRTVYDDVFGGPPKYTVPSFPPCVADYAEIFRGPSPAQKTPPVPFLELASDYDGEVVLVSSDSYADIFGGFACDFTVSLDELLGRSQATAEKKGFRGDSAKKARYVVEGEKKPLEKVPTKISSIRMDNSDGISTSVSENISFASKSANQQLCGIQKKLDMSTQIINHKSKENIPREMLVPELDAASKSTIVVDPDFSSVETCNTNGSINARNASIVTEKVAEIKLDNTADLKSPKRTLLSDSKDNSLPKMFRHELKKDNLNATLKSCQLEDGPFVNSHVYPSYHDYGVDKYESKDVFLSVTEISLQTQPTELPPPSRPPPMLGIKHDLNKRGISEKRLDTSTIFCENSDLLNGRNSSRQRHAMAASGTCSAEEASKQSSPRFLDVEVDMNSAAAAAAMKEVMEEAKAKLKLAKKFRERRKNSLKNNKKLADRKGKMNMEKEDTDREGKRNQEQEECDSAQEFFECALEMTPEVSDCEYKECCQGEHKERSSPKKDSHYPEKQSCLDLDEECAKKSMENGSEVVKESDKNKINEGTHCLEQYRHKEIVELPWELFELQKIERSFVLVQKCTEEKTRKETSVVSDSHDQKTNGRELQVEEVHICRVSENMGNAAVEICEREQNEKNVESDHSSHGREDGMKKLIMAEHDTGMKAVQTTQEEEVHICRVSETMENAAVEICERKQNEKKVESDHSSHGREDGMKKRIMTEHDMGMKAVQTQEEEVHICKVSEKMENAAVEICERKQNEKKVESDHCFHGRENGMKTQIMGEHDTGMTMKAVQTTQQHMETDKKYWLGNEVDGKVPATREIHQQGACSDTLETAQESMKQEKMNQIKQMAAQERMGLEETWQQEKIEEKFASTLETHEEECSNGLKTAQEFKKEDEVHKKNEKAAQEKETRQKEKIEEKFASTLETHEEECSNRLRTSQEFKKEDAVHKKNEKDAQEEEIQEQDENKEQKIVQEESKGNEREEQRATTREPHEQAGNSHGAATTQESREQDEVHENKQKVQQQEEEKLTPDNMVRERNEEEKISARGEIHQDNECSNDLETAEESIKQVEMLKNKKDVAQEEVQLQEEKEEQIKAGQDCQGNEKLEAAQHVNKLEEKDKILKMSHKINEIQGIEQKMRKFNEIHEKSEKEKSQLEKERLKRDREQEMERLMKLEEEKEREREREKDKIAVERATHEARDKSVADAWDKAEKAAVERATVEAREKTPPEPKVVDRTSAEGKFRTERSALDKATAEARERAAERAIVEKVAAEARERMERAVAERFAAALRDKQKKDNDREDGTSLRMNGARSTIAEVQNTRDASSSEMEKRRKAKLDRYRRTTERAAKALEDKKARDILAQREQAERNRLAESLDGDVKRWSTGKEGNLRALLSTLQYILGPENGWQPVPLTEIITSAAVKKAYRKATLCVHPDKVQQRGASVQQKYICEKVFDLLKEAWNKFNSEEC